MTTDDKNALKAGPETANGDGRSWLGLFERSTSFDQLVEQQDVGPFVWPEPCADEDKFDADEFLGSIFGRKMRR